MYVPEPDDVERVHVMRAAAACPVGAILVDVDDLAGCADDETGAEPLPARRAWS